VSIVPVCLHAESYLHFTAGQKSDCSTYDDNFCAGAKQNMLFYRIGDIFEAEITKEPSRRAAHAIRSVVHVRVACHGRFILVSLSKKRG